MKRVLCTIIMTAALISCGPIDYIFTVGIEARRSVANAKAADAANLSPYEYWSAVEYLYMAKEKAAYAEYEIANAYGKKANEMARDALRLSRQKMYRSPNASVPVEVLRDEGSK